MREQLIPAVGPDVQNASVCCARGESRTHMGPKPQRGLSRRPGVTADDAEWRLVSLSRETTFGRIHAGTPHEAQLRGVR